MSALHTGQDDAGNGLTTYHFQQKTTMPSYLIAIAAGNLVGKEIGPRSTVWCEPEMVDAAAWEFEVSYDHLKMWNGVLICRKMGLGYWKVYCYWWKIVDALWMGSLWLVGTSPILPLWRNGGKLLAIADTKKMIVL